MTKKTAKILFIRRDIVASDEVHEIADLAYSLWLRSGFRGHLPEDALSAAILRLGHRKAMGLFLVPKRNRESGNVYPLSRVALN